MRQPTAKDLLVAVKENARKAILSALERDTLDISVVRNINFLALVHENIRRRSFKNVRAMFYDSMDVFGRQARLTALIRKYSTILGCSDADMFIKPGLKGFFVGALEVRYEEHTEVLSGKCIIPDMDEVREVKIADGARVVVVVEKETVVDAIVERQRATAMPCLLVCGKGYPCRNTKRLLRSLLEGSSSSGDRRVFLCLTDFDPFGLDIFLVYKRTLPPLTRVGLESSDLFEWKIRLYDRVELTAFGRRKISRLCTTEHWDEAMFILGLGYKFEAVVNRQRYDFYIQRKLRKDT